MSVLDDEESAEPRRVAVKLSEMTGETASVRMDGSVALPASAMPLPTLDAAQEVKRAGWRFDGYERSLAIYRRADPETRKRPGKTRHDSLTGGNR